MRGLIAAALVIAAATVAQAQSFPLGQPLTAQWEGSLNESDAGTDHYEIRLDNGAWVNQGQPVPQATYTYAIPQALLTIGAHTAYVRGCVGGTCGAEASVAFSITRPLPGLPRNPRVVPTPSAAVLTIPQAVETAQAYATLILARRLTVNELGWLSMQHPPVPPTRDTVLTLLDDVFAEFVIREAQ